MNCEFVDVPLNRNTKAKLLAAIPAGGLPYYVRGLFIKSDIDSGAVELWQDWAKLQLEAIEELDLPARFFPMTDAWADKVAEMTGNDHPVDLGYCVVHEKPRVVCVKRFCLTSPDCLPTLITVRPTRLHIPPYEVEVTRRRVRRCY